jgi:acetoin utilization deacetylase AcuC-like enzyme
MIIYSSPRFVEHTTPPGHPERPERAEVFDLVAATHRRHGGIVREPRPATREELVRVHTAAYLDRIAATAGHATMLDSDTYTSPESHEIALLAAGATIEAAREARQSGKATMALVRPPGHHAEADRAMGFCLYNNVAVAAATLRADGVARVAIVDIDVHHGNGTQHIFYRDPTVLYVSSHQYPYYPGTGAADEIGDGPGRGTTLNIPMEAGTRDPEFIGAYERKVVPALESFRPDVILVSAGFDAHELDPLGGLRVTTSGYVQVVTLLRDAAARLSSGRIAFVTEGGYDLKALRECLEAVVSTPGSKPR